MKLPFRPIKKCIYESQIRNKYRELEKHYDEVINNIQNSDREVLRFAAYVIFDSTYGADGLFKLMMENSHWKPMIVVIPDVLRGRENMIKTYTKTKDFFIKKYGKDYVLDGYDAKNDLFIDLSGDFDVVYCANPYDAMVDEVHSIEYLSRQNCLPIYISYGYDIGSKTTVSRLKGPELNFLWKCFTDTYYSHEDYAKYQIVHGKNTELVGYAKLDSFKPERKKGTKKKILFTPHHTVSMEELPLANFMRFPELIFELNEKYTDIDFVFRPHPLLFTTLMNEKLWNQQQVDEFIYRLDSEGIEYSVGGDYLTLFNECDAIINDCGSFTVEWLYTGKPGCFVYSPLLSDKMLTKLMQKSLTTYFIAHDKSDVFEFVDYINNSNDLKNECEEWVEQDVKLFYPCVSKKILDIIDILEKK